VRMVAKVIENGVEYEEALAEIDALLDLGPDPGTEETNRLEPLAFLVEDYELKRACALAPSERYAAVRGRRHK
jgi:antitoxin component HigA of HigAB toxin-antitoxin module